MREPLPGDGWGAIDVELALQAETASIPACGDGAGVVEGAAPGPQNRETPEYVRRRGDTQPRREGCSDIKGASDEVLR
mgnify:CR=1 FL=1